MKRIIGVLEKNKKVRNFRIFTARSNTLTAGIYGKRIGGAYTPIMNSGKISGELHVEWDDGKISKTSLTSSSLEDPDKTIQQAMSIRIKDEFSRKFIKNYTPKSKANQYSKQIQKSMRADQQYFIDQLKEIQGIEKKAGIKNFEIDVNASTTKINVINSKGLNISDKFTSTILQSDLQSRIFFQLSSRGLIDIQNFSKDLDLLAKLFAGTKENLNRKPDKILKVILSPSATWSLLQFFIINNLEGSLVANGLSRFIKEHFIQNKKVLPAWFSLTTCPRKELTPGASNFTSEGVETAETAFIQNGKLETPILDLKHSQKMNMNPTPVNLGPYITTFKDTKVKEFQLKDFLANTQQAVYVPYFLGLHTQNKVTGDYSLPVPYAIFIREGEIAGRFKAILTGNLYKDLDDKIEFIKWGLFPQPGICYSPNVIIETGN